MKSEKQYEDVMPVICAGCNNLLSGKDAHKEPDGFYCDLCYANTQKQTRPIRLSEEELAVLRQVLERFENKTRFQTGVGRISGGYANASIFDYDDNFVDILLKWGVQSDCEDRTNVEQYKLDRLMLDKTNPVNEILGALS